MRVVTPNVWYNGTPTIIIRRRATVLAKTLCARGANRLTNPLPKHTRPHERERTGPEYLAAFKSFFVLVLRQERPDPPLPPPRPGPIARAENGSMPTSSRVVMQSGDVPLSHLAETPSGFSFFFCPIFYFRHVYCRFETGLPGNWFTLPKGGSSARQISGHRSTGCSVGLCLDAAVFTRHPLGTACKAPQSSVRSDSPKIRRHRDAARADKRCRGARLYSWRRL